MAAVLKDVDAFVEHRGYLRRYLGGKLANKEDTEDLLQEIAIRYWRRGVEPDVPLAYLTQIAHHVLANFYEERKFRSIFEVHDIGDAIEATAGTSMEDVAADIDNERRVARMLAPLGGTKRDVIILHKMYGYSYDEIALKLNLSIHTVEKWVTMAKWILRSKVK